MTAMEEVKRACASRLTVSERAQLLQWLKEFDDEWDRQIDADAQSGRLDKLFAEADADFEAGHCKPL